MRISIFISTLLVLSISTKGQEVNKPTFKFTDFSVSTGLESNFDQATADGFLRNNINSSLIPSNLDLYEQKEYFYQYGTGVFELMAGFAWQSSDERGSEVQRRLRFGLSYAQPGLLSDGYFRTVSSPYDTLTSSQTGKDYYIDSTYHSNIDVSYMVHKISLNTALLWTTNDLDRVSFYGGVNLNLNLNFGSNIVVDRYDYSYLESEESGFPFSSPVEPNNAQEQSTESFKQPNSFGFGFSSPLGLDWRLGKAGKSTNDLHLFTELRPGVSFNDIPGYELVSQFRASWHFGLRFSM